MCNRPPVLIDDEDNRQSGVQKLTFAFRCWLMNGLEYILERNDCNHRGNHFIPRWTTHDRRGYRQRHLLSRTNKLRPSHNDSAAAHSREHIAHPLIYFFTLDHVGLKGTMQFTTD